MWVLTRSWGQKVLTTVSYAQIRFCICAKKENLSSKVSEDFHKKIKGEAASRRDKWGCHVLGGFAQQWIWKQRMVRYHSACLTKFRAAVLQYYQHQGILRVMMLSRQCKLSTHILRKIMTQFSLHELCNIVKEYKVSIPTSKSIIKHYNEKIIIPKEGPSDMFPKC